MIVLKLKVMLMVDYTYMHVLLEVEGKGDGDEDVGIGDSANKGENHFDRLHYASCHLVTRPLNCGDHRDC